MTPQLIASENMLNEIFSYLPGYDIIHKIARLNKRIREALTKLVPFGQARNLCLKISESIDQDSSSEDQYSNSAKSLRRRMWFDFRVLTKLLDFTNIVSF